MNPVIKYGPSEISSEESVSAGTVSKYVFQGIGYEQRHKNSRNALYIWNNANQVVCNREVQHVHLEYHWQYNTYVVDAPEPLQDAVTIQHVCHCCRPDHYNWGDPSLQDSETSL